MSTRLQTIGDKCVHNSSRAAMAVRTPRIRTLCTSSTGRATPATASAYGMCPTVVANGPERSHSLSMRRKSKRGRSVVACAAATDLLELTEQNVEKVLDEEILDVEQVTEESLGLELNSANIETVLDEIRPYLVGTGGGSLALQSIDSVIVKIKITGPAANVMTVRVAVTQKLRERIPSIAAVQLV